MHSLTPPVTIKVGCKVNLYLRITGRRADGYHTLESLFLPLSAPYDTLQIRENPNETLDFSCSIPALEESRSTIHKAYEAYTQASGFRPGLAVHLEKGIPTGAGLGGGSSDAAALLLYLNDLSTQKTGTSLDLKTLTSIAAGIGADVPFFLYNTPSLISGIGEKVTAVENPFKGMHLLLLCPELHVSTAWAFKAFDEKMEQSVKSDLTLSTGTDSTSLVHGVLLQNDLEITVFQKYKELTHFREALLAHGAATARMSGSGASLFGLFATKRAAEEAQRFIQGLRSYLHEL